MTFKYRFILSFVLLEIFFILLIVVINFMAIKNSTNNLIDKSIDSNVNLLEQLIKVPLSIKDTATLDNFFLNSDKLDYVNTIIVLDNQSNILTTKYNFEHGSIESILETRNKKPISINGENYIIFQKDIFDYDYHLGSMFIIFDVTNSYKLIEENKNLTYFIIIVEIIISTVLSYLIGHRLTIMLSELTEVANQIGQNKNPKIPYQDNKDEIGILSKALNRMLLDLQIRSRKLKELGTELRKQKNDLLQANIHKDQFLANMSHELKTPLNSINVISSVMMKNKQGRLDEKQVKNLQIINSCGNDLLYLINDILDISKIEAGELNLEIEHVSMIDIFDEMKDIFEPQIISKDVKLLINLDDNLDDIISDAVRIKQIIKNLLSNAIKFTNNGEILLSGKSLDENTFELVVKDNGIGISSDKLLNIFDRFKQGDGNFNRKYGGTGLGLAICKELSKMLNGDIFVESIEGYGTTFTVILSKNIKTASSISNSNIKKFIPRNKNSLDVEKKITSTNKVNHLESKIKDKDIVTSLKEIKKIILLNQDPISFMHFAVELKKSYELTQINSLDKLEDSLENNNYDLVIMDLSNIELKDISDIINNISSKLIVISDEIDNLEENITELSNYVCRKPFDKNLLKKEIDQLLS